MLHEGESQRSSMTRRLFAPILPLLLGLVLLGVTTGPVLTSYTDAPVVSATEGRQGLDDQIAEECGDQAEPRGPRPEREGGSEGEREG